MKLFKRKNKIEKEYKKELPIIVNFIKEAKKLKWSDDKIMEKLLEKNTPEDLILESFNRAEDIQNDERGLSDMAKEDFEDEEDFDEDDEDEEEDEEEDDSEEDEEIEEEPEEEEKPVVKKKKKTETKKKKKKEEEKPIVLTPEQTTNAVNQILMGIQKLSERLTTIESSLYRLKGSI